MIYVVLSTKEFPFVKKGAFHFNYSKEEGVTYISSPIVNEKVILNDNLKDVLGFKLNIVNGKSAGSTKCYF